MMSNGNSAEASTSPSPAPSSIGNNAPKFGTLVPNRVFVGGISGNTTEQDLLELFTKYGKVKATKVINDRAGVSKGYGFVTFETEEEARKLTQEADNIMLKDRKLNIAPAIKKQVNDIGYIKPYSPRLVDGSAAASVLGTNGTVFFGNGTTYAYTNHMPMLGGNPNDYHQAVAGVPTHTAAHPTFPPQVQQTGAHTAVSAATQVGGTPGAGYPPQFVYPQTMYFPQQYQQFQSSALQPQWATSPQWRWVSPSAYGQPESSSLNGGEATSSDEPCPKGAPPTPPPPTKPHSSSSSPPLPQCFPSSSSSSSSSFSPPPALHTHNTPMNHSPAPVSVLCSSPSLSPPSPSPSSPSSSLCATLAISSSTTITTTTTTAVIGFADSFSSSSSSSSSTTRSGKGDGDGKVGGARPLDTGVLGVRPLGGGLESSYPEFETPPPLSATDDPHRIRESAPRAKSQAPNCHPLNQGGTPDSCFSSDDSSASPLAAHLPLPFPHAVEGGWPPGIPLGWPSWCPQHNPHPLPPPAWAPYPVEHFSPPKNRPRKGCCAPLSSSPPAPSPVGPSQKHLGAREESLIGRAFFKADGAAAPPLSKAPFGLGAPSPVMMVPWYQLGSHGAHPWYPWPPFNCLVMPSTHHPAPPPPLQAPTSSCCSYHPPPPSPLTPHHQSPPPPSSSSSASLTSRNPIHLRGPPAPPTYKRLAPPISSTYGAKGPGHPPWRLSGGLPPPSDRASSSLFPPWPFPPPPPPSSSSSSSTPSPVALRFNPLPPRREGLSGPPCMQRFTQLPDDRCALLPISPPLTPHQLEMDSPSLLAALHPPLLE